MEESPQQPKFQWRLFFFLCALSVPATLAIIPYSMAISSGTSSGTGNNSAWMMVIVIIISLIQMAIFSWPFTGLGLLAAKPLGLGAPIFSALLYRKQLPHDWKKDLLTGSLWGICSGAVLLLLSTYIFEPLMASDLAASKFANMDVHWTALDGFLASFGAGINEEIGLRLFLLTSIAWLGSKLFRTNSGTTFLIILWASNLLSTLVFGALHISNLVILEMPLTFSVVGSTIVMNGMIGLVFGWLYWKHGLESAMLSHFLTDVVLKVVTVLFFPQFL